MGEVEPLQTAPIEEVEHPFVVGPAGVRVPDVVNEKGDETLGGRRAQVQHDRRHAFDSF